MILLEDCCPLSFLVVVSSFSPVPGSLSAADLPGRDTSSSPVLPVTVNEVANLIRVPLIRQYTGFTCGVSALQSIFGYYGQDFRGDKLAKALKTTPENGTDYRDIIRVALNKATVYRSSTQWTMEQLPNFHQ